VFIGTAAVADYRPARASDIKIKKRSEQLDIELVRTTDILAEVAAQSVRPFVVGFAAETDHVEQHALEKLERKKLDLIAANEVGHCKAFDCEDNALLLLWPGGRRELPQASKRDLATALVALVAERYAATRG
jgi:phosphopantothenoylcysteine decarboxylase/phosphopantothenate--cysteine ligase